jgi:hypothetical protein
MLAISGHPRFRAIRVTKKVHSKGPDILGTFLKESIMSATGEYLILFTIEKRLLSSAVVTECNSAMGKSVNDIHLCKNLRLGL